MSIPVRDERVRLFVALDIPERVRGAMSEITRRFAEVCPRARWLPMAGAHVTLKFIGEVAPERAEGIREALREVHQHMRPEPVEMRFAGIGFFPNARRPKVLWAGVTGAEASAAGTAAAGAASRDASGNAQATHATKTGTLTGNSIRASRLGLLAAGVERALEPFGVARETREFRPHITLARFNSLEGLAALRDAAGQLANYDFGSAAAEEFHLYRSVLKPTGAEYTRLDTYPLLERSPEKRPFA